MSEPSKEDLSDTISALFRNMRETKIGVNELRDSLDFYSGGIVMLGNLLLLFLTFGIVVLLVIKVKS